MAIAYSRYYQRIDSHRGKHTLFHRMGFHVCSTIRGLGQDTPISVRQHGVLLLCLLSGGIRKSLCWVSTVGFMLVYLAPRYPSRSRRNDPPQHIYRSVTVRTLGNLFPQIFCLAILHGTIHAVFAHSMAPGGNRKQNWSIVFLGMHRLCVDLLVD